MTTTASAVATDFLCITNKTTINNYLIAIHQTLTHNTSIMQIGLNYNLATAIGSLDTCHEGRDAVTLSGTRITPVINVQNKML